MRDYLVLLIIFGSIPFILVRPWIGILVWSWIGYMNPHKLGWGVAAYQPVAMVVGLATLVSLVFTRDRKGIPWTREMVLLLLIAIYFTMTNLLSWVPGGDYLLWDKFIKIVLMTFVTTMLIYSKERIRWLLIVIVVSLGFYGFKGGIFSIMTGGQHRIWGPTGSFIEGNNEIGLALLMVLPLIMLIAREENNKWIRRLCYAAVLLTMISIIFTYSRGAMLGLVAVSSLLFLKSRKKFLVLILILPLVYIGMEWAPEKLFHRAESISTYEEDWSSMQRLQAWSVSWNIAMAHPFIGTGFNYDNISDETFAEYASFLGPWNNRARAAHSIYFQIMGDHGFGGFLLYMLLLVLTMLSLRRIRKEAEKSQDLKWIASYATAIQLGLVGFAVSGNFLSLAYFDLFYAYVAITAILARELKTQTSPALSKSALNWHKTPAGPLNKTIPGHMQRSSK